MPSKPPSSAAGRGCRRLSGPLTLNSLLAEREVEQALYFADEAGGRAVAEAFEPGPALILIGPEGGFTDEERRSSSRGANAAPVSLGPRHPSRGDGGLGALAAYMAIAGDWGLIDS